MPSDLWAFRMTDPIVGDFVIETADKDFEGNRSAAIVALLRVAMNGKSEIVTRPEKSVSGAKPKPRKTTVKRGADSSSSSEGPKPAPKPGERVYLEPIHPDQDARVKGTGHPDVDCPNPHVAGGKGTFGMGKTTVCVSCGARWKVAK